MGFTDRRPPARSQDHFASCGQWELPRKIGLERLVQPHSAAAMTARVLRQEFKMNHYKPEDERRSWGQAKDCPTLTESVRKAQVEETILPEVTRRMLPPKQSMPGDSARLSYMSE